MGERVRVAVRIRAGGDGVVDASYVETHNCWDVKVIGNGANAATEKKFQLDYAFDCQKSQEDVWNCLEDDVMQRIFDQDNHAQFGLTLMAYGQTGSGKTYAMMGPEKCKENPLTNGRIDPDAGIILRVYSALLNRISQFRIDYPNRTYQLTVGMIEVYKEKIRDLLGSAGDMDLGENQAGVFVREQAFVIVHTLENFAEQVSIGYRAASVGSTNMNERSSRAHTIITIKLRSTEGSKYYDASITIADLAGSERAATIDDDLPLPRKGILSRKTGTRSEGIAINQSLLALGNMIHAAQSGSPAKIRANSRSSVLTRLLLASIGGSTISFLLIAVRDQKECLAEIKSSLDFGQRARKVMNIPKMVADANYVEIIHDEKIKELEELSKEKEELSAKLGEGNSDGLSAEYQTKLTQIFQRLAGLQDEVNDSLSKERDEMQARLGMLEMMLCESEERKKLMANRAIKSVLEGYQQRSVTQVLRQKIVQPWISMPLVPCLVSEDPHGTGVAFVICSPLTSFGSDRTRSLVLGSDRWSSHAKHLVKEINVLRAHCSIARVVFQKQPGQRAEEAKRLLGKAKDYKLSSNQARTLLSLLRDPGIEFVDSQTFLATLDQEIHTLQQELKTCEAETANISGFVGLRTLGLDKFHCSLMLLETNNDQTKDVASVKEVLLAHDDDSREIPKIAIQTSHSDAVQLNNSILPKDEMRILKNGDHIILLGKPENAGDTLDSANSSVPGFDIALNRAKFVFVEPGGKNFANFLPDVVSSGPEDGELKIDAEENCLITDQDETSTGPAVEDIPTSCEQLPNIFQTSKLSDSTANLSNGFTHRLKARKTLGKETRKIRLGKKTKKYLQRIDDLKKDLEGVKDKLREAGFFDNVSLPQIDLETFLKEIRLGEPLIPSLTGEYLHVVLSAGVLQPSDNDFREQQDKKILQKISDSISRFGIKGKQESLDSPLGGYPGSHPSCLQRRQDSNGFVRIFCMDDLILSAELEAGKNSLVEVEVTEHDSPPRYSAAFASEKISSSLIHEDSLFEDIENSLAAVFNSLIYMPVLSCYEQAGSVHRLCLMNPKKNDRLDRFLLEITIANALMDVPARSRWLQGIAPVLIGEMADSTERKRILGSLSEDASFATNKVALKLIAKWGYPINTTLFSTSIRAQVTQIVSYKPFLMRLQEAETSSDEKSSETDDFVTEDECAQESVQELSILLERLKSATAQDAKFPRDSTDPLDFHQGLQKLVAKELMLSSKLSLYDVKPQLDGEYFHCMISYRVRSEGEGENSNMFSINLRREVLLTAANQAQSEKHWLGRGIPPGKHPEYAEPSPGSVRVFLDVYNLQKGAEWDKCFSKAVCNTLVLVPLISASQDHYEKYTGSIGDLVGFDPIQADRVDNFLLEITIAIALMDFDEDRRWLQAIFPIFMGGKVNTSYTEFDFRIIDLLSAHPSIETNRKAAEILRKEGYPASEAMLSRSIQDIVRRIAKYQGVKLWQLGIDSKATEACAKQLCLMIIPRVLRDVHVKWAVRSKRTLKAEAKMLEEEKRCLQEIKLQNDDRIASLEEKVDKLDKETRQLTVLQDEVNKLKEERDGLNKELDSLRYAKDVTEGKLQTANLQLERARELEDDQVRLRALQEEVNKLKEERDGLNKELDSLRYAKDVSEGKLQIANLQLDKARETQSKSCTAVSEVCCSKTCAIS